MLVNMAGTSPIRIEELLAHAGWVNGLARQLVGGRGSPEDLAQDAWLAAIERPPQHAASLAGWLRTTMRRLAARSGTKRQR